MEAITCYLYHDLPWQADPTGEEIRFSFGKMAKQSLRPVLFILRASRRTQLAFRKDVLKTFDLVSLQQELC